MNVARRRVHLGGSAFTWSTEQILALSDADLAAYGLRDVRACTPPVLPAATAHGASVAAPVAGVGTLPASRALGHDETAKGLRLTDVRCVLQGRTVLSIDEAFFDVTPGRYSREDPVLICKRIQERIGELGISCSIGLGQNKTVAKIASERDKPHGLCVVMPGRAAEFLAPLPVEALSGVGPSTKDRLKKMGIRTLGQLAQAEVERMRRVFGVHGPKMVQRAAGRETSKVTSIAHRSTPKSVSNERTFSHDLTSRRDVEAAIAHVSALVGTRLRSKGLRGGEVTLKLRFDYEHTRTIQRPLVPETDDERDFGQVAKELLSDLWSEGTPVRLVGVMVSGFGGERSSTQLALFDVGDGQPNQPPVLRGRDSGRDKDAKRRLSEATDSIRSRFGAGALTLGYDLRLKDTLSDTISNNHDGMSEMPGS